MKSKYIVAGIVAALAFGACGERDYDETISPEPLTYAVADIAVADTIYYNELEPTLPVSIELTNARGVSRVYAELYQADPFERLSDASIELRDDGEGADAVADDLVFAGETPLSPDYRNGAHQVFLFADDADQTRRLLGEINFVYDNGADNVAPRIALIDAPDTIDVEDQRVVFQMYATVVDSNGVEDIESVFLVPYRPDGTTSGARFALDFYGDNDDFTATYYQVFEVTPENDKGTYRFDFEAIDRGGKSSGAIPHTILVK
jgi:hypothetical protein